MKPINIFEIEPLSVSNPIFSLRASQFRDWISALPDEPGSITLEFGMLDGIPHRYEFVSAPAGDLMSVTVKITDLMRSTVIAETEDLMTHPEAASLGDKPGFWLAGLQVGLLQACGVVLPAMQTEILASLFEAADWDYASVLQTCLDRSVDSERAAEYLADKAMTILLCGISGFDVLSDNSPIPLLLSAAVLSDDDASWLQSIVHQARERIVTFEAMLSDS